MNIIYITTAIREEDFAEFAESWKNALNSSNQTFHHNLIKSLSINNHVDVICIRPFGLNCSYKKLQSKQIKEKNITWHYLNQSKLKIYNHFLIKKQVKNIFKSIDKNSIILADILNSRICYLSLRVGNRFKSIALCTDSVNKISNVYRSYKRAIIKYSPKFDGYICQTEGLNSFYNKNNKPYLINEGVINNKYKTNNFITSYSNYFLFAGALMEKYGIYSLISAFKEINNSDIALYICGHHENKKQLYDAISDDPRIKFLGLIPNYEVKQLENKSIANVNPRPISDLDNISIPSKTLEYLASNSIAISVKNEKIFPKFKDEAIWIDNNSKDSIKYALNQAITMNQKDKNKIIKSANNKVNELYSLESVNKRINDFLSKLL